MSNKFKRMANTLPSFYKAETNTIIRGLLMAWGLSDDEIEVQIANTKDQIFVNTAEGRYLEFLGNNVGVVKDPQLGLSDDDFRKLIPILSFAPKQVRKTIVSLLDVFWGPGFTRANLNSGNIEPFNFGPDTGITGTISFIKGNITLKGTGTQFLAELAPGQYIKPLGAPANSYQKIAAIISNTELQLTNAWSYNVAINSQATLGAVRELSYIANDTTQGTIRFKPSAFQNLSAVTAQELANFINTDPETSKYLTASVFMDPQAGNRLNIRTNTPGLRGSLQFTGGDANAPSRLNLPTNKQTDVRCSVYEVNPNEVVIRIPSSVPVLRRTLRGSSHGKLTKTEIFSQPHLFDFASIGTTSTLNLTVDGNPYTVTFNHSADFKDPSSATSSEVVAVINRQLQFLEAFTGQLPSYNSVGLRTTEGSAEYQVTGGTANAILGFGTSAQTDPDLIQTLYPSAYLFDPTGQLYTVTGIKTEIAQTIASGAVASAISLTDASSFPNKPGKLIFNFGRKEQEGPIAYNSRPNNSTLLIDASHIFQNEHTQGRMVNLISDSPTIPRLTGSDYPVYIVGTEEARSAAQALIRQLLAAGVVIRFIIDFPEVLFECVCRDCSPSTDPSLRGSLTGQGPLVF